MRRPDLHLRPHVGHILSHCRGAALVKVLTGKTGNERFLSTATLKVDSHGGRKGQGRKPAPDTTLRSLSFRWHYLHELCFSKGEKKKAHK